TCLTGIGQHYDSINESVMAAELLAPAATRVAACPVTASCRARRPARSSLVTDRSSERRRRMSYGDTEPSEFQGGEAGASPLAPSSRVTFDRRELNRIFGLYGRKVAAGEWRDYAIDFLRDRAVFSVFRRASEVPIYRIEKHPRLARRQ